MLEHAGVISGYRAQLDAQALGLTFDALVFITMRAADRQTLDAVERAVAALPDVLQAQRLFGDPVLPLARHRPLPLNAPQAAWTSPLVQGAG